MATLSFGLNVSHWQTHRPKLPHGDRGFAARSFKMVIKGLIYS